MTGLGILGVGKQLIHRSPVLNEDEASPDPELMAEKTQFRMAVELLEHSPHGQGNRELFVNLPELIDSHADKDDHEVPLDRRRHFLFVDHCVISN